MQYCFHYGQDVRPAPDFTYAPPSGELKVLFADQDMLVVEKPSGLLSVPGRTPELADCLESRVRHINPEARIVHRLDMDTSGVMVLALNGEAHRHLGLQFERRHVSKTYIADVENMVTGEAGTIDLPLRCDWPNRPKQMVCYEHGRRAITRWKVLERRSAATRLELNPLTGRSHQLRVHLMACGHPIINDSFYSTLPVQGRMHLHALELTLHKPTGGERVTFRCEPEFGLEF
jgi:tRNA pseudouridine32 synthase/23S rRNA pseudouridine746 synthase